MEQAAQKKPDPAVEARIRKKIQKFDLVPLLRLLLHMGYQKNQIRFKSYNSQVSQKGLIHDIKFRKWPEERVELILNLGLLAPQTPLPSYFQKIIDKGMIDVNTFYLFINFFDHPLAANLIQSVMPETNKKLFPDWERTKRNYIKMMDLKSVNTLYWFISLYFPELELRVDKTRNSRDINTNPFVIGTAVLGDTATFGARAKVFTQGVKVTFFAEDQHTAKNVPWPKEIRKRLEKYVFPALSAVGIHIQVLLVIKYQHTWAKLDTTSYLGYDKIKGGKNQLRVIKIFHGHLIN